MRVVVTHKVAHIYLSPVHIIWVSQMYVSKIQLNKLNPKSNHETSPEVAGQHYLRTVITNHPSNAVILVSNPSLRIGISGV